MVSHLKLAYLQLPKPFIITAPDVNYLSTQNKYLHNIQKRKRQTVRSNVTYEYKHVLMSNCRVSVKK